MLRLAQAQIDAVDNDAIDETIAFFRRIDAPLVDALLDPDNAPKGTIKLSLVARVTGRSLTQVRFDMDFLADALRSPDLQWFREALDA